MVLNEKINFSACAAAMRAFRPTAQTGSGRLIERADHLLMQGLVSDYGDALTIAGKTDEASFQEYHFAEFRPQRATA